MSSAAPSNPQTLSDRANALWEWLDRHFSFPGLLLGSIFFALSLTPSLLPRTETVQGILSGCCFAVGYGAGNLVHWLWGFLGLRAPPGRVTRTRPAGCAGIRPLRAPFPAALRVSVMPVDAPG